jgi:ABC-type methionine transport system ATPase subunit
MMIKIEQQQLSSSQANQPVKTRIQFKIPQKHYKKPIICALILDFELQVNVVAAILGKDGIGGGCFDLELEGDRQQIDRALTYLSQLDIEIWRQSKSDEISDEINL